MSMSEIFDFQAWAANKDTPPPQPTPTPTPTPPADGASPYGQAALARELASLAAATEGTRNDTLNRCALNLYQLADGGHLTEAQVTRELEQTARSIGLDDREIRGTLNSARRGAHTHPRTTMPDPTQPPPAPPVRAMTAQELAAITTRDGVDFWDTRPELGTIRDFARARMVAPWAVLGQALIRCLATIPPFVVIPPIIGGPASLNSFLALVGPSGAGKGASEAVAAEALITPCDIYSCTVGSGEGIVHQYAHRERQEIIRDRDQVHFTVPEVDGLVAQGKRQGATLMSQLRSAWSGEPLGFSYADSTRRIPIGRHSYRFTLTLGVQPGRAADILDDADGGTPQRFIWLPVIDPDVTATPPPAPDPIRIHEQPWGRILDVRNRSGLCYLPIPEQATQQIREAHVARVRGDGDALDGHALLARTKIAQAFALLADRPIMSPDDWHMAGVLMDVSDATRQSIQAMLAAERAQHNQQRGLAEARQQIARDEEITQHHVKRVARLIVRKLTAHDGLMTRRDLTRSTTGRDTQWIPDALAALEDAGQIELVETNNSTSVHLIAHGDGAK